MWSLERQETILGLVASGVTDREIARRTGVPRATVGHWRRSCGLRAKPDEQQRWRPRDPVAYSYLLGIYLGDGHIVRAGATARIRITLDARYLDLVDEARLALEAVFPEARVARYERRSRGAVDLGLSDAHLALAFPQAGPGKKHERPIVLEPWQVELTHSNPGPLIRGLIHSDGCRTSNRFMSTLPSGRRATYEYPRYFFSNLSADIRAIFCEHCDLLGIRWTLSNPRNISIAHRDSVALLDTFVGPKP